MNLSKIELYQKMEEIIERIGKDQFIDDLFDAMNSNELQENFEGITSDWLLEKVKLENKEVSTLDQAFSKIKEKDFDVILTVGAGDIDTLSEKIINWLKA